MQRVNVLTYNIYRARLPRGCPNAKERIVEIFKYANADLLCLQEVWQDEGVDEHQLEELCKKVWNYQVFQHNAAFPKGSQGNATLARWEILEWINLDVSIFHRKEKRGILHVKLRHPYFSEILSLLNVHFGLGLIEQSRQFNLLEKYIVSNCLLDHPLIVAGDFNDWTGHFGKVLERNLGLKDVIKETTGKSAKTFPSRFPLLPLDHIFYRNLNLVEAKAIKENHLIQSSDHLPLMATFDWS